MLHYDWFLICLIQAWKFLGSIYKTYLCVVPAEDVPYLFVQWMHENSVTCSVTVESAGSGVGVAGLESSLCLSLLGLS